MTGATYDTLTNLVAERATTAPFLVGVGGSVSVGKTTIVLAMAEALKTRGRSVYVLSTDGFLFPNRVLKERDLLMRKGFPESYDHQSIETVLRALRAAEATTVNVYSHDIYDILPDSERVHPVELVFVEGVIALQEPAVRHLDLKIYIAAAEERIRGWYVDRFLQLVGAGRADSSSFYSRFAALPDEHVRELAINTWESINSPNLRDNIAPSMINADIVVEKAADHSIDAVRIRHPH